MLAYMPIFVPRPSPSINSTCVPSSTIRPCSMTMMRSHDRTVDNLCATNTAVRPRATSSKLSKIPCSVAVSNADVASSATSMRGSRKNARAIATRCFSPPLSFTPRSPTMVWRPAGMFAMVLSRRARLAAMVTSSSLAEGLP
mmetsp:Transcript_8864/g.32925  ORF Transcript_8864/g.32925 Transcript_8864/m.32925 type:complete len:142 (-) Transcript_8864:1778-2203(-)